MVKARTGGGSKRKSGGSKKRSKTGAKGEVRLARLPDVGEPTREDLIPGQVAPPIDFRPGPRKTRADGAPAPRLSNHKTRSMWFRTRAAYPVREAPVRTLVTQRDRVMKSLPAAQPAVPWEAVGPTNIGGRTTSLVCHSQQPERIWIGAAGGGVWFSPDAGQSWTAQWHDEDVLNIGALAIDPTDPAILYCGTGEANLSADSYGGVGLYRTLDAGTSWHLLASRQSTGVPARIGVIAIDPFDRLHIVIGGVGYAEMASGALVDDLGGMYVSHDGGVTWHRETFISARNYWCHSIVFDPVERGRIYATFTSQGMKSGIYRSMNGGQTWTQLTKNLPSPARFGRTSLAIAPSDPKVIYAQAADQQSQFSDLVLGIFRSRDGGNTWKNVAGNHFSAERQMMYGNAIAVHPTNPNLVICGGVDLHRSTNGGNSWQRVTQWDAARGTAHYAHADHHALIMPAARPGRVYDANDGGLDLSEDGGKNWMNRSNGLAVSMFYDVDVAESDPRVYGGGLQDNGTCVTVDGNAGTFIEILGGDGGWIIWDPADAGHVYASYQFFNIFRFRNQSVSNVSPPADPNEANMVWMCYIAIDPNNANVFFTGSNRVWRTKDDANTPWQPVSPPLDGSVISSIEIARADSQRIYVGTENGGIFRSDDGGDTWTANISSSELPGFAITRLATSPADADVVYATVANFGPAHVFRSTDGGATWADIDNGQLPQVPHHVIVVVEQNATEHLYVGNDVGVFTTDNGGQLWRNVSNNLPHTMVVDVVHHEGENALIAATYGRSLWRLKL